MLCVCVICVFLSLSLSSNVKMMPAICRLNNSRNFNANDGFVVVSSVPAQTSNKQHERNYFHQTEKNWNTERFCIIFVDMMRTSRENSIEQLSSSASSSKQQRDRKLKLFEAYIPTYRLSQRAEFFSFSISLCSLDGGPYTYVMNVLSHHR